MKIELYIDRQLCDIGDPKKFSVTLRRQLYNPAELNTKDAQASYTINLPASMINNRIFGYANVEEVRGKFDRLYDAELIVNGIKIFEGKFKMSAIDSYSYKGNLGVPTPKTLKEIFGDKNMNKLGEWNINLEGYKGIEFITEINKKRNPDCIFPLVLYGLLPKTLGKDGKYSDKDTIDESVRFGIEDFPPSVNCIEMLRVIFREAGYKLSGTALDDERLKQLYVSYKNPNQYPQEWNWGDLCSVRVKGSWTTIKNRDKSEDERVYERVFSKNDTDYGQFYVIDMLDSINTNITDIQDSGTNVIYREFKHNEKEDDDSLYMRKHCDILIPKSGYYKIRLEADMKLVREGKNTKWTDKKINQTWIQTSTERNKKYNNWFEQKPYEIQVLRDFGSGDFGLSNKSIAGHFYKPNLPQNAQFNDPENNDSYPKWFPQDRKPIIVDPSADSNLISGLHFGRQRNDKTTNPYSLPVCCHPMFIKSGWSWDKQFSQKHKISSIYPNDNWVWWYGDIMKELEREDNDDDDTTDNVVLDTLGVENPHYKYRCILDNIPEEDKTYIKPRPQSPNDINSACYEGEGRVASILWLEKGERITVAITGEAGDYREERHSVKRNYGGFVADLVKFDLSITPFRTDLEWNKQQANGESSIDDEGKTIRHNWNDEVSFRSGKINLIDFLPSQMRADDWIENFCRAFNLKLNYKEGTEYSLDVGQRMIGGVQVIDLDSRAHVVNRRNQDLNLPSSYKIGFSINSEEEGYHKSIKEDNTETGKKIIETGDTGGGEYLTGSTSKSVVEQKSNFSHCWYKKMKDQINDNGEISIPVISDKEVWDDANDDYKAMMKKLYFDKAQRFWYKTENYYKVPVGYKKTIETPLVTGNSRVMTLDYSEKGNTIKQNYYYLLNNNSNYTEIECHLSPQEYRDIDISLARFNGDLYNIVSIDGYDPSLRKAARIRLIPRL